MESSVNLAFSKVWGYFWRSSVASGSLPRRYFVAISQAEALLTKIEFSGFLMMLWQVLSSLGSLKSHQSKI